MANDNYYHLESNHTLHRTERKFRMTLREAGVGRNYKVKSLDLDMVTVRRLGALGITRGTNIRIINRNHGGAVILMVRGSRLAIGRKIAEAVFLTEAVQVGEAAV